MVEHVSIRKLTVNTVAPVEVLVTQARYVPKVFANLLVNPAWTSALGSVLTGRVITKTVESVGRNVLVDRCVPMEPVRFRVLLGKPTALESVSTSKRTELIAVVAVSRVQVVKCALPANVL